MNGSKVSKYPWKVLGIVMLGTLMAALDSSIVNVSLPAMMADFGASLDDIEWVITGYMLGFAAFMPLTTWFRDVIGHKFLYIFSLVVFTAGSVLCGLAWNLSALIVARLLQALGGAALTPTGMAMISEEFAPAERAKALAYWGLGVIVGPAFGPTLGGWLTHVFGWRSIFLINLPIGVIGTIWALGTLRRDQPHASRRKPFDLWGFLFLAVALVGFLLGISKGEHEGWTSPYIIACLAVSAVAAIGFLLVESIVENTIIDLELFRFPVFSACMAVTVVRSIALFGGVFLLPLFLQQVRGLDEIDSGLIMLPGSLVVGFMMPLTPRLMSRFGTRLLAVSGLLIVACFMFMYRHIDINTSTWDLIFPTLIRGVGLGMLFTPVMVTALNHVPVEKTAMASSMLNLIQQIGGSIGIAMLATVFSHRMTFHVAMLGGSIDSRSPAFRHAFHALSAHAHTIGYSHAQSAQIAGMGVGKMVARKAMVAAFGDSFLFGTGLVLLGVIAALLLPGQRTKAEADAGLAAME